MILTTTALVLSLSLAADPPQKNDTMKDLLKDTMKEADVSGMPFTPDTIRQIVLSYQPKIQSCYEEHISAKKKAPEGKLATAFTITPDGLVKNAKIDRKGSTLKDPALHDCVVAVLSTMQFPKPPDQKDHPIEFPFNLKAVH
ncbi:MAG: AgmX/PglI C-terminal domain-containing protein [Archangium sp.]|nr:AgmX/PglI C-terminal domain-containing protein [Archangium sp.]